MEDISFQHVFSRVYSYLCEAGVEMTSERCRQMLQLIDDAMAAVGEDKGGHRLLQNVMDRLPDYFSIPEARIPLVAPPLSRGSIGYRGRG
ncbi:hypothetical protein [Marinobacter sp. ANT_B65]|uniref:hypothetical protein n=1 Tax=Marinobacter sp. ANT_B65 TaxID=2039467 RepID=UPI000BBE3728|nr:hypothetical protein [Marinobacter sp. ANT_B65]PCM45636.1 hypothetical protein CPA50_06565 [Marinobacter sp. ANT_B65]